MHRVHSWAKAHASSRSPPPQNNSPTRPTTRTQESLPPEGTSASQFRHNDGQVNPEPKATGEIPPSSTANPTNNNNDDDDQQNQNQNRKEESGKPALPIRMKNGSIRFFKHTKTAICHSWVNVLLVFVPAGIAAQAAGLNPSVIFALNAVAVVPLAGLLSHATECVACRLGDTVGALINVTFGNAVELIVFIALVKNEIRIVQASLLGSILANLLLIMGMAFLLGGLRFQEQIYNSTVTQMSACLLSLSVTSLLLPTAFHASWSSQSKADKYTLKVSRGTSVVLLLVYILYILFQLKSHSYLYASIPQRVIDEESHPGVLAELMNHSSDSSSSSSDDSDDSGASISTAKRLKKAMKHRIRRKSSVSSKGTVSRKSVSRKASADTARIKNDRPNNGNGRDGSREVDPAPRNLDLSDETAHSSDDDNTTELGGPRPRDFGQQQHGDERVRKDDRTNKDNFKGNKCNVSANSASLGPSSTFHPRQLRENMDNAMDPSRRRSPFRPTIPSLLSNTVFSSPQPSPNASSPTTFGPPSRHLRRSNSVPTRMNRPPPLGNAVQLARGAARIPPATDTGCAEPPPVHPQADMSRTAAVVMLLVSTALVAVCAEFLVDAIPEMINSSSVSQAFIGLIILPIVSNAAEHVTAVSVATKNKMDLSIGVSVGSSIQIAIFVTPLVVILGWIMDKDMSLYFTLFETISLFVTAFVVNFLVLDGRSNYLEGALLIAGYIIIAVAAFYFPSGKEMSDFADS